jgi:hypothetical protein
MENGKAHLPLVVTAAPGFGGVSPPFSILPEKLAEQTEAFGQAVIQMIAAPVGQQSEAVEVFSSRLEDVACSLDEIYLETSNSLQSINAVTGEAFRKNFEQSLRFVDDLVSAKGLSDIFNIQFGFVFSQIELFAEQSKNMQYELTKMLRRRRG